MAGRIVLPNGQNRAEYIRQEFAKGRKRGDIAKELGVAFQIVYAATKPAKGEASGDSGTEAQGGESSSSTEEQVSTSEDQAEDSSGMELVENEPVDEELFPPVSSKP